MALPCFLTSDGQSLSRDGVMASIAGILMALDIDGFHPIPKTYAEKAEILLKEIEHITKLKLD